MSHSRQSFANVNAHSYPSRMVFCIELGSTGTDYGMIKQGLKMQSTAGVLTER